MRRLLSLLLLATLAACSPAGRRALAPAASDPRTALLITPADLARRLSDSSLTLLHVGTPADYAAAHLPGARLTSVMNVNVADTARRLSVEMPSPDTLRSRLAALGISDGSRVVVYFGEDMVFPTTRILFTLFYAGLGDRAVMLDGGLPAWEAEGRPTTAAFAAARTGSLSALRLRDFVVDADAVRRAIGKRGVSIVDARDAEFYTGARRGGTAQAPHRAGHIPSAKSVPWMRLYDEQLRLKPRAELARLFADAGIGANDLIIGYCHTGQQATAMLLAARTLGHRVLLYDGSYQEWSARAEMPVETQTPR
ncbi:MAG: sulfurtransferase [Gemmatimonadetes bacterium]|nr:sulfurtransferase [Gemmatimonadota bacterium]